MLASNVIPGQAWRQAWWPVVAGQQWIQPWNEWLLTSSGESNIGGLLLARNGDAGWVLGSNQAMGVCWMGAGQQSRHGCVCWVLLQHNPDAIFVLDDTTLGLFFAVQQ